jgi:putative molybdopterin biosynthesis protein
MQRRRYLRKLPLEEAQRVFLDHQGIGQFAETEELAPRDSLGRITAEPVFARISSPHYHCSAMDGVAVRAEDTFGASTATPVRLGKEQFYVIDTGDPIPAEFNAVIMIEDVREVDEDTIEVIAAASPWQYIRMAGEDIVATELILTRGHRIRPIDVAAMLSGGVRSVVVKKKPVVAIIPTGDELVEPGDLKSPQPPLQRESKGIAPLQRGKLMGSDLLQGEERTDPNLLQRGEIMGPNVLQKGEIIDSNSYMLEAVVSEWGGEPRRLAIVEDDYEKIKDAIRRAAAESDIVLTSAGSSAGREDFVPPAIEELGELLVHGVSISPGKPTALGIVDDTPVLGLPGYPVSMAIAAESFLKPLLCKMLGIAVPSPHRVSASVARKVASKLGSEEFVRVKLSCADPKAGMPVPPRVGDAGRDARAPVDRVVATPLARGASVLNSLVRADGIMRIPANSEGLVANETVEVELMRPLEEIRNSVVIIGSHDMTLDVLADEIKISHPEMSISSAHVGSLGGLMALKRHEAHIAGTHLLDEETGDYNSSYIKRFLPDRSIALINLVYRQQGLMVAPGNPKDIRGLADLGEGDITFCNRQRGSGTRILLDYQLNQLGIAPEKIAGYDREVYTHMVVASAVATGIADAGLGIFAAAKALGLDFVPIAEERYDLAIPEDFLPIPGVSVALEVVETDGFRERVQALGGYDTRDTGKRMV